MTVSLTWHPSLRPLSPGLSVRRTFRAERVGGHVEVAQCGTSSTLQRACDAGSCVRARAVLAEAQPLQRRPRAHRQPTRDGGAPRRAQLVTRQVEVRYRRHARRQCTAQLNRRILPDVAPAISPTSPTGERARLPRNREDRCACGLRTHPSRSMLVSAECSASAAPSASPPLPCMHVCARLMCCRVCARPMAIANAAVPVSSAGLPTRRNLTTHHSKKSSHGHVPC
jgi:hypothetical protein